MFSVSIYKLSYVFTRVNRYMSSNSRTASGNDSEIRSKPKVFTSNLNNLNSSQSSLKFEFVEDEGRHALATYIERMGHASNEGSILPFVIRGNVKRYIICAAQTTKRKDFIIQPVFRETRT